MVMRSAITLACTAAAMACGPAHAGPEEFHYVKKATREESRAATLAQYQPAVQWGPWHVIGPFDNAGFSKHDVVYPPELRVDLDATYSGKSGAQARWVKLDEAGWNIIDLRRFGSDQLNTNAIAYLWRELIAENDGQLAVDMGSDDGLKVWFNGRLLVDADVPRGLNPQDHRVSFPLKKRRNDLLVKVTQGPADWQFQMKPVIDDRLSALLEYHLNRDFPTSPEAAHYQLLTILEPRDIALEVGGLTVMPDGRPVVTTRRGDVWIIDGAYADPPLNARFTLFASGLHEPLGAQWRNGALYVVQRGEVTRLVDSDGDDRADRFETVSDRWGVSGNYHEFAFGPKFDGQGRMWVTLNVGFCGSLGKSIVPWRGWAVIVNPDGSLNPVCGGLRSPNGVGANAEGDVFYTDNQGDWIGTNKLAHLDFGDWHGHPAGDRWYSLAGMRPPRGEQDFKQPAVWFPYDRMGRSASDIALDDTGGKFGPFENQLFVGDQYSACVMRVFLEKVNGVYQGACFPFRSGFDCGVNRLCFAPDGSLLVGMTNRGWWSMGDRQWGLQRVVFTGEVPFEVRRMRATSDGFELEFTKPLDAAAASEVRSYALTSFTHHRWEKYGSPEIDHRDHAITAAAVSANGRSVRLTVDRLRTPYVFDLRLPGVRSAAGEELLHKEAYYTLNQVPQAVPAKSPDDPG